MTHYAIVMLVTYIRAPLVIAATIAAVLNQFYPGVWWLVALVVLMAASALTDLFDGKLARKWGCTSRLGALLDPLMDKVFYAVALPAATFIAMYHEDATHALLLLSVDIVSVIRDQWVSFLRSVGSEYGADVKADFFGKLRTFLGLPIITLIHLHLGLETLRLFSPNHEGIAMLPAHYIYGLEVLFLLLTLFTTFTYTRRYLPYLKKAAQK